MYNDDYIHGIIFAAPGFIYWNINLLSCVGGRNEPYLLLACASYFISCSIHCQFASMISHLQMALVV